MRIGWIGAGLMGAPMVGRLLDAGHEVALYTRSGRVPTSLEKVGVRVHESLGQLALDSDVIITILGGPRDVEEVYLGADGLLSRVGPGSLCIDMTTSSVELARRLAEVARDQGVGMLDAPVSGGPFGAETGTLSIMVGGSEESFARAAAVLAVLGRTVVHHGASGAGQCAKLANQLVVAAVTEACAEAFLLARGAGLEVPKLAESINAGAAGSPLCSFILSRLDAGDASPGFKISHLRKDLDLVDAEAERLGLALPLLALTRDAAARVESTRGGEVGTQLIGSHISMPARWGGNE